MEVTRKTHSRRKVIASKWNLYTGCMIRDRYANRTNAPQPQMMIAGMIWAIALFCLFGGSQPKWGWCMVAIAVVDTVYVATRFLQYYGARKRH
jgi:hypothetical protein